SASAGAAVFAVRLISFVRACTGNASAHAQDTTIPLIMLRSLFPCFPKRADPPPGATRSGQWSGCLLFRCRAVRGPRLLPPALALAEAHLLLSRRVGARRRGGRRCFLERPSPCAPQGPLRPPGVEGEPENPPADERGVRARRKRERQVYLQPPAVKLVLAG